MAVDTTAWVVTNQHLAAMNEAAKAAILAARQHQDYLTMEAVRTVMDAYELLLLQWGTERGLALGDVVNAPRWQPHSPDGTP